MPNRYSQLTQTQYVPQYAPAPIDQYSQLAQQSAQRFRQAKMQDATTRALATRALGTSATEKEREILNQQVEPVLQEIRERAEKGDYHESLLDAKTMGVETAAKIKSTQQATKQARQFRQDFFDQNENVNRQELRERYQMMDTPEVEFDEETGYARLSGPTSAPDLAPDANLGDIVTENLKNVEPSQLTTTNEEGERVPINPVRYDSQKGAIITKDGEEITGERARRIAELALQNSPEAKAYLDRREDFFTQKAQRQVEQSGGEENPLEGLVNTYRQNYGEDVAQRARESIQEFKDMGFSDSEIYGRIMRNREKQSAINLGEQTFAFRDPEISAKSMPEHMRKALNEMGSPSSHLEAGQRVNPHIAGVPEEYSVPDINEMIEKDMPEFTWGQGRTPRTTPGFGEKAETVEERIQAVPNEKARGIFQAVRENTEKKEGESTEDYISRLEEGYKNFVKQHKNTVGIAERVNDPEGKVRDKWFGNPNDPSMGRAESLTYYNMTPGSGEYGEPMTVDEMSEKFGLSPKEFSNRASIQGRFKEDDAIAPGGLYVTVQGKDTEYLGDDSGTKHIKVSPNDIEKSRDMVVASDIAELELDPSRKEGMTFQAYMRGEEGGAETRTLNPKKEVKFINKEGEEVPADTPGAKLKTDIRLELDKPIKGKSEITRSENPDLFRALIERGTPTQQQ